MEVGNRKIKFRAWDSEGKRWLVQVPKLEDLLDDEGAAISHHDIDPEDGIYFYPKNPLGPTHGGRIIYTQFTGLLDKNGQEIYEGDIVEYNAYIETIGERTVPKQVKIIYHPDAATFGILPEHSVDFKQFNPLFYFRGVEEANITVVGNIFEK